MSNPNSPESPMRAESGQSFGSILSQFERSHAAKAADGLREGTVVSVSSDSVFIDLGLKTEGILQLLEFQNDAAVKPGDKLQVTIKGRDPGGYYLLTRSKAARPTDWAALERAFADKTAIVGTVTGVVKGGLSVDIGVRAFMPASRSGVREAAEMEKLVEQEIHCRIIKLDAADEDVVVDRRVVAEEEEQTVKDRRYSELKEGDGVRGTVTRVTDFGAFVELEPGVEGLIHVSEMSWVKKVRKPSDLVKPGETVEAVILGINVGEKRISLGLKQALGDPWADAAQKFPVGSAIEGPVVSLTKFGAFVQVAEGIEGMVHVSDISADRRINHPQDMLKIGQPVKAQVLELDTEKRRLKLGMKQLVPTSIDEYVAEHQPGDLVSGRVVEVAGDCVLAELGEGIRATCRIAKPARQEHSESEQPGADKRDVKFLSSMLAARWKTGSVAESSKAQEVRAGQVRSFRITTLDPAARKIEVELV